jgi:hypothetical protein
MSSNNIDSARDFYGNGTVYVADPDRVRRFDEYNFNVESLRNAAHGDYWVTDEIIVALGSDVSRKKALKVLRRVAKKIEREIKKGRRYR